MRMMKQENPAKFIMMMLQQIGISIFSTHLILNTFNIFYWKINYQVIFYRLLDREQAVDEEATVDDEEENGFLKAFKVMLLFDHYQNNF